MTMPGDYALRVSRLGQAVAGASEALAGLDYYNIITGKPAYSVITVIPGGQDVQLTREGSFVVAGIAETFTPAAFLNYVLGVVAKQEGSTRPSMLGLDDLLERFISEMEKVPQIAPILQKKGSSGELKALLR